MTNLREILGFLLLFLLYLAQSKEAKTPEPIFRQQGEAIEMGYCFGVDYISVYRSGPDGDQLLGSSSDEGVPPSPPKDYQGRVNITNRPPLLGLQISHLRHSDSGLYRRECWRDAEPVDQHESKLSVCEQEVNSREISITEDGGAVLSCKSDFTGQEGVTIQWYHEVFPQYKAILFLDTGVSPEPLQEELRAQVDVRDGGTSLRITAGMLKSSHQFYCLVMAGERCLSFHNTFLPEAHEFSMYVSEGETVVLNCPSENQGRGQRWETPLGHVNTTRKSDGDYRGGQMYTEGSGKPGNYSLVIPVISKNSSGHYSCFSPYPVAEFSLVICPTRGTRRRLFSGGGEAVLECEAPQEATKSVLWYRRRGPGRDQLILDSKDRSVALPEYLRGRVTFSDNDSSLRLTELSRDDAGEYFCVVLMEELPEADDYGGNDDDDDDDAEDDYDYTEYKSVDTGWLDASDTCISKQETNLQMREAPGDPKQAPSDPKQAPSDPKQAPGTESSSNTALYAGLGAGGLVLLLGVVIAIGVVLKKRGAGANEGTKDTELRESKRDAECMEKLNPN